MNDWTDGYVADVGYTFGHYAELSLERMRMAFLSAGLQMPAVRTACELGFGYGVSVNLHAAASTIQWHGNDFNPVQAAFAQELADACGHGGQFVDDSFADFCSRADLPDFDFISLHGIWSWISHGNRAVIADFIRRKLRVGGVVYLSYNTQPGWASMIPMRHLLAEHASVMGSPGAGISARIGDALEFGQALLDLNPAFTLENPHVKNRFQKLRTKDRAYLAHEYFNRDWQPMPFAELADWMGGAKLEFACSAHIPDHMDDIHFTPAQLAFLRKIPQENFRQTVRDFLVDQQFRRDYWIKGLRRIGPLQQTEQWRQLQVVLVTPGNEVTARIKGNLGEIDLPAAVYRPLLDALGDHRLHSVAQLELRLCGPGMAFAQLLQAIRTLHAKGDLALAQDEAILSQVAERCSRLNAHLMHRARGGDECQYLVSPVTGTGVPMPRFHQLFLLARSQGKASPAEWATFANQILQANREQLLLDGRVPSTPAAMLAEINRQAADFAQRRLPVLETLAVS